jgi:hypothetical protein
MLKNSGDVLLSRRQRLDEISSRRGLRCGLSEKCGERLHLIPRLDLPYVFDVARVEQLRAISGERQLGLRAKDLIDTLGRIAFPAGPGEQEGSTAIAGRAGTNVVEVEGVPINELDAEITLLLHRRHGDHEGLGTQVRAEHGVKRV